MSEEQQQAPAVPVFAVEKLYVKDLSIEVPNAPHIFLEQGEPEVSMQLQSTGEAIGEGVFEVVLTSTVSAKIGEKTVFLVEVGQAGIFRIENVPEADLEPIINIACPNLLFPYAREAVSNATNRAGFQPVNLAPVNFEAIYFAQKQQRAQEQAATAPTETPLQ